MTALANAPWWFWAVIGCGNYALFGVLTARHWLRKCVREKGPSVLEEQSGWEQFFLWPLYWIVHLLERRADQRGLLQRLAKLDGAEAEWRLKEPPQ